VEEISSDGSVSSHRDDMIEGLGLTIGEMQAVARRQFVGSLVVAILVLAVSSLAVLRSNHLTGPHYAIAHNIRGVQQPSLAAPSEHLTATAKRAAEVP
jgi:hypothetical protein